MSHVRFRCEPTQVYPQLVKLADMCEDLMDAGWLVDVDIEVRVTPAPLVYDDERFPAVEEIREERDPLSRRRRL